MAIGSDHPEYERIETDRGVVWRFREKSIGCSFVTIGVLVFLTVAVPLAEAVFALVVIDTYAGRAPAVALTLAWLFATQMLFVASLSVRLGWQTWLSVLASFFGKYELALLGERLFVGRRIGPWRLDRACLVEEVREVILFLCQGTKNAEGPEPSLTSCIGVVERAGETPYPYVMDFPPGSGRALAEELAHELAQARKHLSPRDPFPPLRVVESTLEAVQKLPDPKGASPSILHWLRRRWWVAATLAGSLGLSGLTVAVFGQPAPRPPWAGFAIAFGWLMELVFLTARLPKANPPPEKVSEFQRLRQEIAPPAE